jgi:hypothetical protein
MPLALSNKSQYLSSVDEWFYAGELGWMQQPVRGFMLVNWGGCNSPFGQLKPAGSGQLKPGFFYRW